jgi:hypothetical protein
MVGRFGWYWSELQKMLARLDAGVQSLGRGRRGTHLDRIGCHVAHIREMLARVVPPHYLAQLLSYPGFAEFSVPTEGTPAASGQKETHG